MRAGYEDILALAAGKQPLWWDENGVPRFAEHHPHHCPDIYADEVVLLEIACQLCGTPMRVQLSTSSSDKLLAGALKRPYKTLAEQVKNRTIHYGDPPHHNHPSGTFCHAGCTMNCNDLRVVEFWSRERPDWQRARDLEIYLPDADETCDQCDPSFGCWNNPAACSKRPR